MLAHLAVDANTLVFAFAAVQRRMARRMRPEIERKLYHYAYRPCIITRTAPGPSATASIPAPYARCRFLTCMPAMRLR